MRIRPVLATSVNMVINKGISEIPIYSLVQLRGFELLYLFNANPVL